MTRKLIQRCLIWPIVWLGAVCLLKSGGQARWIFEKIQSPRALYIVARNMLNFRLGIPRIVGWISMTVEPAAVCNLTCSYCARAKDKQWIAPRPPLMDRALFTKIIDETPSSIEAVCLSGIGEPLMHPAIVEMIEYAHKSGRRVYMFTNGTLLKGELMHRIAQSSLDGLNVSIEPDAESARHYRDVDYDEIAANIRAFAAAKRKGMTVSVSLVMNEMHNDKIARFEKEWSGVVDHIKLSPQVSFGCEKAESYACSELWRGNMDIKTDGSVSVCCFDPLEELVIGNAATMPLDGMLNNEAYGTLMRRMLNGDVPPRCRRCTISYFSRKQISRVSQKKSRNRLP